MLTVVVIDPRLVCHVLLSARRSFQEQSHAVVCDCVGASATGLEEAERAIDAGQDGEGILMPVETADWQENLSLGEKGGGGSLMRT